ncbi:MAG TPA: ATP-binding cassette domain-containing protein [Verrucomicrobiae bacterium]
MSTPAYHPAALTLENAALTSQRDPEQLILKEVNWTVLPDEFWVVAGPQHAGKTDLLLHAAGLMTPAAGSCKIYGCDTHAFGEAQLAERLRMGFVFADDKLFSQLTIAQNLALPLRYHRNLSDAEAARTVELLLELLELGPMAGLTPANVPAGWRHRAALGRALVLKPQLLLLDNPLGNLPARQQTWLLNFLEQLSQGHPLLDNCKLTIIATTDDLRPWQNPRRKFAVLQGGSLQDLGHWGGPAFATHAVVQDLLLSSSDFKP